MAVFGSFVLLITGFIILIRGAHYLVEGASAFAKKLEVSEIAIGLTVISFGTSAPELAVNVLAALEKNSEIILGNIIGSNLMNILLVLGCSAAILPLHVKKNTIRKEIPFSLIAAIIFLILANDIFVNGKTVNDVTRSEGLVLLTFFLLFLGYVAKLPRSTSAEHYEIKLYSNPKIAMMLIIGIVGLTLGGELVKNNAIQIANHLGISHKLIGLTIVAGGTSLPELVTSVVAALKKRIDMAVGNIVGSNIFNLFFVLGISCCITNIEYPTVMNFDVLILIGVTLILFFALLWRKRPIISRQIGILFLLIYAGYLYYLIWRK